MAANAAIITKLQATRVVPEDLSDVIELLANEDTPFTSNIGRGKATQTYTEWNTDTLANANEDNKLVEGEDVTLTTRSPTSRMGNFTQIMTKVPAVSGTMQAINIVGGQKELARELMKCGRELKLDREKRMVGQKPAVNSTTDTTAREAAGFGAWLRSSISRGGTGANAGMSGTTEGYPNSAVTPGTNRALTEQLLKDAMASAWGFGGKPKMMLVNATLKGKVSAFPGIAANRVTIGTEPVKIIGTADIYLSDFGKLSIVPDAYMPAANAWLVDPEYAELMTLRPVQTTELAKSGDSEKRLMVWEGTLKVNNEKAHAGIADIT